MLTKEQKECRYCNFGKDQRHGYDFGDGDGWFHIRRLDGYYINAWRDAYEEKYDTESERINYCPMCGRDLRKED